MLQAGSNFPIHLSKLPKLQGHSALHKSQPQIQLTDRRWEQHHLFFLRNCTSMANPSSTPSNLQATYQRTQPTHLPSNPADTPAALLIKEHQCRRTNVGDTGLPPPHMHASHHRSKNAKP
jgi:hypothetical protein